MAGGYVPGSGNQYDALVEQLRDFGRRLAELETPTGTSMNSLVAQVQQAIANITATVTAAIAANSYTKVQIDSKIASPGAIAPTTATTSGDVQVGGKLLNPDAVSYVITTPRYTGWIETSTGRHGNTSSSRRFKQDIVDAQIDVDAFLSVVPFLFHYIAEVRKRDDPSFEEYIGPDYVVADEYGLMAEDLDAAGMTPWVYYDADGRPESVNYTMLVVPLLAAARQQQEQIASMTSAITDLLARVAALEGAAG